MLSTLNPLEVLSTYNKGLLFHFNSNNKVLTVKLTWHLLGNLFSYWLLDGSHLHFKCYLIHLGHLKAMKK